MFANRERQLDPGFFTAPGRYPSAKIQSAIGDIRQQAYDANVRGNIAEVQRLSNQRRNLLNQ
jgi:hypothetical protein